MIDLNNLAPLTPENIHRVKPLAYLGRGAVKAMTWIDDDTLAVATSFGLWHYTRDGGQREVVRFGIKGLDDRSILRFFDNGKILLVMDRISPIFLYDSISGTLLASFTISQDIRWNPNFTCSQDQTLFAAGSYEQVRIFETANGKLVADLDIKYVFNLTFFDNQLLMLNHTGIYRYDCATGTLRAPQAPEPELLKNWMSNDRDFYLKMTLPRPYSTGLHSRSVKNSIQLWEDEAHIDTLNGHEYNVVGVLFVNENTIISFDDHDNILIWQDHRLLDRQPQMGTKLVSTNLHITAIAAANQHNEVIIWDRESGKKHCFTHGSTRSDFLFEFDGNTLLSDVYLTRNVFRWSLDSCEIIQTIKSRNTYGAILSPDRHFITRNEGNLNINPGKLILQDLTSGEIVFSRESSTPVGFIKDHLLYAPDVIRERVVNAVPGIGRPWDILEIGDLLLMKVNLKTGVEETFLSLAPYNLLYLVTTHYAIRSGNEGVAVFDCETHRLCGHFHPRYDTVSLVKFSPDGRYILIVSENSLRELVFEMWEIDSGQQVMQAERKWSLMEQFSSLSVPVSPDSRFVAFCDEYYGITLWKDGVFHAQIEVEEVYRAVFSPDSRLIFGICIPQEEIYVWDTETGRLLATLKELTSYITIDRIVTRPDLIAISNNNGTIGLWGVEND